MSTMTSSEYEYLYGCVLLLQISVCVKLLFNALKSIENTQPN